MARIVIAIPHGSIELPPDLHPAFAEHVDAAFLRRESDAWTGEIYAVDGTRKVHYPWHRFVADPNRSEQQETEGGVVPDVDFGLQPLYPPGVELTAQQRASRVEQHHRPYQDRLRQAVSDPTTRFFIDAHSMAEIGPLRGPDPGLRRPDVVLCNLGATDGEPVGDGVPVSCTPELFRWIGGRLSHHILHIPAPPHGPEHAPEGSVWLNEPFDRGYGVTTHAAPARGVHGIQIELSQRLWLNAQTFEALEGRIAWMNRVTTAWCRDIEARLEENRPLDG